jgi:hypothetical protein
VLGHEVTVGGGGADVEVGVGVGAGAATVGAGVGVGVGALAGVRLFVTLTVDEVRTVPPGVVATIASVCGPLLRVVVSRIPSGSPSNWYGA